MVQQLRRRLAAIALACITTVDAFVLGPPSALINTDDLSLFATASDGDSGIPSTFPLARRALLEKAEEMGALSKSGGTYSTVGWSNRLGSLLTPAAVPGVYEAGRPFLWNSIDVGCRMVVIELSSGNDGKPDHPVGSQCGSRLVRLGAQGPRASGHGEVRFGERSGQTG